MNTSQTAETGVPGAHARPFAKILLLVTEGCHFCEDARAELASRADRGELDLDIVTLDSACGRLLQATYRPAMFPLVLLNGKQFSVGRLPRRKLDRALARGTTR